MNTQRALQISCTDGSYELAELEAQHYLGPIEYAWTQRGLDDPTILGVGPLAGTCVPGASGLVVAARSLLWDGFHATSLAGGGQAIAGLGCSLLGRCRYFSASCLDMFNCFRCVFCRSLSMAFIAFAAGNQCGRYKDKN